MPKELIANSSPVPEDQIFHAEVVWSNDHVQVATVKESTNGLSSGAVQGVFVNLDRSGINKMIRVLRRARDYAYGKDE